MKSNSPLCMVVLALSEAELYFMDCFIEQGCLPNFQKLREKGRWLTTSRDKLVGLEKKEQPSQYMIWSSIYTGLLPADHGVERAGQKSFRSNQDTIWAELDALGYRSGMLGVPLYEPQTLFLQSNHIQTDLPMQKALSYLPVQSQSLQDLLRCASVIYPKNYVYHYLKLLWQLLRVRYHGLPFKLIKQILHKIPRPIFNPKKYYQYRLWHAELQMSIFEYLHKRYAPNFAVCQIELLSHLQSRFWRAFEPEKFSENLGNLDKCWYTSPAERYIFEQNFKNAIQEGFIQIDTQLHKLMTEVEADPNAVLVVMNGVGQDRHDPVMDANPTLLLHNVDQLMRFADLTDYHFLGDKCRDITLNFNHEDEATLAAYKLSEIKLLAKNSFFQVKQVKHQLFLEIRLTPEIWTVGSSAWIENEASGKIARLFDFVYFSPSHDQETSKSSNTGWLALYGNLRAFEKYTGTETYAKDFLYLTQIKDFLMQYFKI